NVLQFRIRIFHELQFKNPKYITQTQIQDCTRSQLSCRDATDGGGTTHYSSWNQALTQMQNSVIATSIPSYFSVHMSHLMKCSPSLSRESKNRHVQETFLIQEVKASKPRTPDSSRWLPENLD
ncbi:MAG: hypothetical protein KDD60_04115, partial [Bdellovibrionales bacterium]|nr:hypothetical protein [Bdellovibrionales bacterium]